MVINTKNHEVILEKNEVNLTRKEFMLLEYMARNSGKVLSRGNLMEHVWDMNTDPFSNTIESHILNLRRKLAKASKKKVIHTIPGRGYKVAID